MYLVTDIPWTTVTVAMSRMNSPKPSNCVTKELVGSISEVKCISNLSPASRQVVGNTIFPLLVPLSSNSHIVETAERDSIELQ